MEIGWVGKKVGFRSPFVTTSKECRVDLRNRLYILAVITFVLAASSPVAAQSPDGQQQAQSIPDQQQPKSENPAEPEAHGTRLRWQDIPKNVFHDEKAIFTSPFHINRDNARWWLLFGGTTAALIASDQKITNS